jgi:hypothetical protein
MFRLDAIDTSASTPSTRLTRASHWSHHRKHHIPGTISVGNAAIEIDRIKQEQMKVQENGALSELRHRRGVVPATKLTR